MNFLRLTSFELTWIQTNRVTEENHADKWKTFFHVSDISNNNNNKNKFNTLTHPARTLKIISNPDKAFGPGWLGTDFPKQNSSLLAHN